MSQTIQKVFASKKQKAVIFCEQCNKDYTMDVSGFMGVEKAVRLKYECPCGESFPIMLERRSYVRKKVKFKGNLHYQGKTSSMLVVHIVVMDVSRYGVKIKLFNKLDLVPDQKIVVDFELDDVNRSKITKEGRIKNIDLPNIGIEFISHDHYDKFGAYVLFHLQNQS